ncbi:uncharacterized protein DC041_0010180 [Schistosoma bovis]|uniref:Uncharacterized protein n=1 Tax=Schistosoma bovis TaxID=6184 RepID=A0A430Q4L1_SCHBO|nr:uncharacterized protein DC041_0010180 [Schistosoma bovis]
MNDILKSNEIINNNELDILIDDINDDEELSSLIQSFPKETKQFILKLRNSHLDKSNNGQLKQNSIKQTHRCLTNFDVEAPFSTSTTYRNTFCHQTNNNVNEQNETSKFPIGQPILRFGEMPVFTDSILYPGQNRRLQSTTHETFVEKPITYTEPAKPVPTNLRVEGERDFLTTNKSVYTVKPITGCPVRRLKMPSTPKPRVSEPFSGETQFRADFPPERAWNSVDPMSSIVPQPCQPPKAQIQLRDTNEISFHTEQRDQFQGHDAKTNPKPKSFKHEPSVYTKPAIKLDCNSVTKLDFQPYTTEQILSVNAKSTFGRKIMNNDDNGVQQSEKMKPEELKLLKNYLKGLKSAKNQQLPKM